MTQSNARPHHYITVRGATDNEFETHGWNEYFQVVEYHVDPTHFTIPGAGGIVASQTVDLSPDPTWPSPQEASDRIAEAVRAVMDAAWYHYTGDRIDRDEPVAKPRVHGCTSDLKCPIHGPGCNQ